MKSKLFIINAALLCLFVLLVAVFYQNTEQTNATAPALSEQRKTHILYGDRTGGGHHHSANKPCKSEFPENWDEGKIIETVHSLASNDNARWRREDNGYHVSDQEYENLDIRIVIDEDKSHIITAYPTNVPRNPCPR